MEPHARGAILVAAIFDVFLLVYRARSRDLFRIATQGTGVLPKGDIHPDLANRLADEAARCAQSILQMCIRALDYCPPVNITFGAYLRAAITADVNFSPEDEYRTAFIESFRRWGIYPRGIRSMSIEALTWPSGAEVIAEAEATANRGGAPASDRQGTPSKDQILDARSRSVSDLVELFSEAQAGEQATKWDLETDRHQVWKNMQRNRRTIWRWLVHGKGRRHAPAFGLVLHDTERETIYRKRGEPTVEVHSVRTALRRDARGSIVTDLVIEVTQRRRGYFDKDEQTSADEGFPPTPEKPDGDFKFRAGSTIVIDTTKNVFRHIIRAPGTIADDAELDRVRRFLTGEAEPSTNAFDGVRTLSLSEPGNRWRDEPFAMLHRHEQE
jgi:hypothetical protein